MEMPYKIATEKKSSKMSNTVDGSSPCKCGVSSKMFQVKKEGPNKGRWFFRCAQQTCEFFQWAKNNVSYSNVNAKSNDNSHELVVPKCSVHHCDAVLRRVNKKDSKNVGRYFWTCPKSMTGDGMEDNSSLKCKLFKWCDQPDRYLHLLNDAKKSNNDSSIQATQSQSRSNVNAKTTTGVQYNVELEACSLKQFYQNSTRQANYQTGKETNDPDLQLLLIKLSQSPPKDLINELKNAISDTTFNCICLESEHIYTFPLKDYYQLLELLKSNPSIRNIQEIPEFSISMLLNSIEKAKSEPQINWDKIPKSITQNLLPFQKQGVEFGIRKSGRVLIGDEMGLGKTVQAIAIASYYIAEWPLLILCPSSLRHNWRQEISRWMPNLDCSDDIDSDVNIVQDGKVNNLSSLVNIVSYTLATKEPLLNVIKKQKFKVIIADECHYLKSGDSKRSKNLCPIISSSNRAILLSGTASPSRPIELYTQFKSITQNKKIKKTEYAMRYCDLKQNSFGRQDYLGASHLSELNLLLSKTIMIRRLKADVLSDLPPKRRSVVYVQADNNVLNEINALKLEKKEKKYVEAVKNSQMSELYKLTGTAKLKAVQKYVKDRLKDNEKFLVFAHHVHVLDGIEETVKLTKKDYIRIDGSTNKERRLELATRFRSSPDCYVAILSITAAGTGLSFTPCSMILFAELHWTPGILSQAEDRCHRIGQTASFVDIKYLLAKGTADDSIWPMIKTKLDIVGQALDNDNQQGKKTYGSETTNASVFMTGQTTLKSLFIKQAERNEETNKQSSMVYNSFEFHKSESPSTSSTASDVNNMQEVKEKNKSDKKRKISSDSSPTGAKKKKVEAPTQKNTIFSYFGTKK